ncbi:MAG: zinc ribbon domain-containing protein [Actinobacteria bacterium]|nr:zinc ribbon domain-containing protein [Actinomycetota bacterium]MBU1944837.1 zinc ribbon domain-containing protein [Actinomycetota bacterium]MBU2687096.1 zinc ribbon domain-containing protein [Actinomycetota bacterium]
MKCEKCGYEAPEGKRFCKQCGAPFESEAPQAPPAPVAPEPGQAPAVSVPPPFSATTPVPGTPPPPPVAATAPRPAGRFSGSPAWKALAIILVVLIAGGVVTGIVFGLMALLGSKPAAKVEQVTLTRKDGKPLDLDKVPLGEELVIEAKFIATYGEGGRGTIKLAAVGSDGSDLIEDTFEVKSSSKAQTRELAVTMTVGSGKPLKAHAELVVRDGQNRLTSSKDLTFTAEEGNIEEGDGDTGDSTSGDEDVEAAKAQVETALEELQTAFDQAEQLGVDVSDLVGLLPELMTRLAAADTMEEVEEIAMELADIALEINDRLQQ